MQIMSPYSERSKAGKIAIWVVGALAVMTVIGSVIPDEEKSDRAAKSEPAIKTIAKATEPAPVTPTPAKPPKKKATGIDPKKLESQYESSLGRPIGDMCDAAFTHWACFYGGVSKRTDASIKISLSTDGGWSDDDLDDMASTAARHWFNFVGEANPKLDSIVVFVNGRDRETAWRADVPMLK